MRISKDFLGFLKKKDCLETEKLVENFHVIDLGTKGYEIIPKNAKFLSKDEIVAMTNDDSESFVAFSAASFMAQNGLIREDKAASCLTVGEPFRAKNGGTLVRFGEVSGANGLSIFVRKEEPRKENSKTYGEMSA